MMMIERVTVFVIRDVPTPRKPTKTKSKDIDKGIFSFLELLLLSLILFSVLLVQGPLRTIYFMHLYPAS